MTATSPATPRPGGPRSDSIWAQRLPGLADAADGWLAQRDTLLAQADDRAEAMLRSRPLNAHQAARAGGLVSAVAPKLLRHLGRRDPRRLVQGLADVAVDAGPTYVKLGQLLASSRGLVPEWVSEPFARCRDAVPPAPAEHVAAILESSGIAPYLTWWDPTPLASASIAQVHEASLVDGRRVAVKVRRDGISRIVAADVAYLLPLLRLTQSAAPALRPANLPGMLELMVRLFAQEVDLRLEAVNVVELALVLDGHGTPINVPAPIPGLVKENVLVMEYVTGVPWSDAEAVAAVVTDADAEPLVRLMTRGVLDTALVDGIFHGDLHSGNVLVDHDHISLVDFGIVARLDPAQREALSTLVLALFAQDQLGVLRGMQGLGAIPPGADLEAILPHLGPPLSDEEARLLMSDRAALGARVSQIQRVLGSLGFGISPALALFGKNLAYLADALDRHAPDLDLIELLADTALSFQRRRHAAPGNTVPDPGN